jgi:hypothetical protein
MNQEEQGYGSSDEVEVTISVPDKKEPEAVPFSSTDHELKVLRKREQRLTEERDQAIAERDEYKKLYLGVADRHWNTLGELQALQHIVDKYIAWFNYHKNWIEHHNRNIKWSTKTGKPDTHKDFSLSTVATSEAQE